MTTSNTETPKIRVTIFGPNLNSSAQRKGQFHVHAVDCADCAHYGPGRKFGGDDRDGWQIKAASRKDVGMEIYADMVGEGSMTEDDCDDPDIYIAPCVRFGKPKAGGAIQHLRRGDSNEETIAAFVKTGRITNVSVGPFRTTKASVRSTSGRTYAVKVLDTRLPAGERGVWASSTGWNPKHRQQAVDQMRDMVAREADSQGMSLAEAQAEAKAMIAEAAAEHPAAAKATKNTAARDELAARIAGPCDVDPRPSHARLVAPGTTKQVCYVEGRTLRFPINGAPDFVADGGRVKITGRKGWAAFQIRTEAGAVQADEAIAKAIVKSVVDAYTAKALA